MSGTVLDQLRGGPQTLLPAGRSPYDIKLDRRRRTQTGRFLYQMLKTRQPTISATDYRIACAQLRHHRRRAATRQPPQTPLLSPRQSLRTQQPGPTKLPNLPVQPHG
jgi:hypothetical protein